MTIEDAKSFLIKNYDNLLPDNKIGRIDIGMVHCVYTHISYGGWGPRSIYAIVYKDNSYDAFICDGDECKMKEIHLTEKPYQLAFNIHVSFQNGNVYVDTRPYYEWTDEMESQSAKRNFSFWVEKWENYILTLPRALELKEGETLFVKKGCNIGKIIGKGGYNLRLVMLRINGYRIYHGKSYIHRINFKEDQNKIDLIL